MSARDIDTPFEVTVAKRQDILRKRLQEARSAILTKQLTASKSFRSILERSKIYQLFISRYQEKFPPRNDYIPEKIELKRYSLRVIHDIGAFRQSLVSGWPKKFTKEDFKHAIPLLLSDTEFQGWFTDPSAGSHIHREIGIQLGYRTFEFYKAISHWVLNFEDYLSHPDTYTWMKDDGTTEQLTHPEAIDKVCRLSYDEAINLDGLFYGCPEEAFADSPGWGMYNVTQNLGNTQNAFAARRKLPKSSYSHRVHIYSFPKGLQRAFGRCCTCDSEIAAFFQVRTVGSRRALEIFETCPSCVKKTRQDILSFYDILEQMNLDYFEPVKNVEHPYLEEVRNRNSATWGLEKYCSREKKYSDVSFEEFLQSQDVIFKDVRAYTVFDMAIRTIQRRFRFTYWSPYHLRGMRRMLKDNKCTIRDLILFDKWARVTKNPRAEFGTFLQELDSSE